METVFKVWLLKQEESLSPPLSIREAKWVATLCGMTEDIERVKTVAEMCAEWELIGELTSIPQLSSPSIMLHIYEIITKKSIGKEREQRILMEKQVIDKPYEQTKIGLEHIYGKGIIRASKEIREGRKSVEEVVTELRQKEVQNERTHNKEIQE